METIRYFIKELYRAFFPRDGMGKEEMEKLQEHLTGSFLLETNIKRLLVFFPVLYITLIAEWFEYRGDTPKIRLMTDVVIGVLFLVSIVGNILCVRAWKESWGYLTRNVKQIKIIYHVYWWCMEIALIFLAFIEMDFHHRGTLFVLVCLYGFSVSLDTLRSLGYRVIFSIAVYFLIVVDATENVYYIKTSLQMRQSMFFISLFIILICFFLQRYQFHIYLFNAFIYFQASIDELTGCFNRKGGQRIYKNHVTKAREMHGALMIDIDYFKYYNDVFGHAVGDEVLRKVGTIIKEVANEAGGLPIRHGGEEFVILCTHKNSLQEIAGIGHRIQERIAEAKIEAPEGIKSPYLTVSIGVAKTHFDPEHEYSLFVLDADRALYKAKENGRNRVCIYGE